MFGCMGGAEDVKPCPCLGQRSPKIRTLFGTTSHLFRSNFNDDNRATIRSLKHLSDQLGFLISPETFRADFGHDNSLCILKTKTFLNMKLYYTFDIYYLKDLLK